MTTCIVVLTRISPRQSGLIGRKSLGGCVYDLDNPLINCIIISTITAAYKPLAFVSILGRRVRWVSNAGKPVCFDETQPLRHQALLNKLFIL